MVLRISGCSVPFGTGLSPSLAAAFLPHSLSFPSLYPGPYPDKHCCSSVWALPRSLATTCGITVVFSSCGYLDVSVPRVSPRYAMDLHTDDTPFIRAGFPHSDIRASSVVCTFTRLFAACHVLLRLQVPGHSPCALSSLTCSFSDRLTVFQSCSPFFLEVFFIRQRLS